ncbi:hypothetical protein RCL1_003262 [Eukaryota sp. TZLM3-RCL]
MRILNSGLDPDSEDSRTINSFAEQHGEAYIAAYRIPAVRIPLGQGHVPTRLVGIDKYVIRLIDKRVLPLESSPIEAFNSLPVITRTVGRYSEVSVDFTKYKAVPSNIPEYTLSIQAASELYSLIVDCCYALPRMFTSITGEQQIVLLTSVLSIFYRPLGRGPNGNDLLITHRGFPVHYVVDPVTTVASPSLPQIQISGQSCLKPGSLIQETHSTPPFEASNCLVARTKDDSSQLILITTSSSLRRPNSTLIDGEEVVVASGLVNPPQDELTTITYQTTHVNTSVYTADIALVPLAENVRYCNLHLLEESDWNYCEPRVHRLQRANVPTNFQVTWNGNYHVLGQELLDRIKTEGILVFLRRPNDLLKFGKIDYCPTLVRRLEFQINADGTALCASHFGLLQGVFLVAPVRSGCNMVEEEFSGSLVADIDGNVIGMAVATSYQLSVVSLLEPIVAHFGLEIPTICQCDL